MHKACPVRRGRKGDRFGAKRLDGFKSLSPALEQDADQIDDHMGITDGGFDRIPVAQIGLHGMDLADPSERLQVAGEVRAANGDADAVALLAERAHDVAAEKAGAAEDGDQLVHFGSAGALLVWRILCFHHIATSTVWKLQKPHWNQ